MAKLIADQAPWLVPQYRSSEQYRGYNRTSRYLEMRDGVKIAIDLYLPKGIKGDKKLPCIIYQTRYYRRFSYNRLLRPYMLRRDGTLQMIKTLVKNGYAFVCVDVRGTGASFGSRQMEFSPEEIADGSEIVDWIVEQNWSDGVVGTIGTSYTGSTAELLITNHNPALKAAIIRYANFDSYPDVVSPGGVRNRGFMRTWSNFNQALDSNQLSEFIKEHIGRLGGLAIKGMDPVDDDRDREMLDAAVEEHSSNYDIYETSKEVVYRDDVSHSGISLDQLSPYARLEQINASGIPIYNWSSWFDGGFTHSAIKRFLNLEVPGNRLILGPWDHGGDQNPNPHSGGTASHFDHNGEVLRFFDHYLKGTKNEIDRDPPVRYFTMAEEAWKSAETWPPPGFSPVKFFCNSRGKLIDETPAEEDAFDQYLVDYTTTTGKKSRWVSLVNVSQVEIGYPDRVEQDKKLLVYQTDALDKALEVTGHPMVTLYVRSDSEDLQLFVYLEDVTEKGEVIYVTEGQIRGIYTEVSAAEQPYKMAVPYHSFKSEDSRPLRIGEVTRLSFDLLPVSYMFKKGHAVRIAIAGADRDNFALEPPEPPVIEVMRSARYSSHINLPGMWK